MNNRQGLNGLILFMGFTIGVVITIVVFLGIRINMHSGPPYSCLEKEVIEEIVECLEPETLPVSQ